MNKGLKVWNDMRQNFHFWVNYPFKTKYYWHIASPAHVALVKLVR